MQVSSRLDASTDPGQPIRPSLKYAPMMITIGIVAIMALYGRIAQPLHYNEFADGSAIFGIHHAADVVSNAGFALVAIWGWLTLWPRRSSDRLREGWPGYRLFLIGLLLTAFGSGFYHLAPDNARLIWDRLPIALACAGLLVGVRGDTQPGLKTEIEAIVLGLFAVASVAWWVYTDSSGADDLRPYLLLQILPLVLIPLWQAIYRAPRAARRSHRVRRGDGALRPGQDRRGARPRDREHFRLRQRAHLETSDRHDGHSRRRLGADPAVPGAPRIAMTLIRPGSSRPSLHADQDDAGDQQGRAGDADDADGMDRNAEHTEMIEHHGAEHLAGDQ
jgi:hypothetical protein